MGGKGGSAPPPPMSWGTTPVKRWNPRRNWRGWWLCVILKSKIFFCKISPAKCRKLHLRYSRFQNFSGEHAPGHPRMTGAFGAHIPPPPETITLATPLVLTGISDGYKVVTQGYKGLCKERNRNNWIWDRNDRLISCIKLPKIEIYARN